MKRKLNFYVISFLICVFLMFSMVFIFYRIRFPLYFKDEIKTYCAIYNLDSAMVASLINEESSFKKEVVSNRKAVGLMQILPSTAEYICALLGEEFDITNLFEPETNIRYGCFYLNYLQKKFFNEKTVLCAYNAGETIVSNWLKNIDFSDDGITLKKIPFKETEIYVKKIANAKKYYSRLF